VAPSPVPKNPQKILDARIISSPDSPLLALGRCCLKIKKKRKENLNLIFFELWL
jgi:hypothetical protein